MITVVKLGRIFPGAVDDHSSEVRSDTPWGSG